MALESKFLVRVGVWLVVAAPTALAQAELEWFASHDGPQSQADYGRMIAVDGAGDVYVAGRSYNPSVGIPPPPPQADFELVKFSPGGSELWTARYDTFGSEDNALDVQVSPSGDVYVTGYAWNANDIDLVLLKYSSAGAFQWIRTLSGVGGSDFGRAIAFDLAGNVLLAGNTYNAPTNSDVLLRSYTPAGTLNWSTSFDGGANGADAAYALRVMPNGEIVASGQVASASQGGDFAVWKLDLAGNVLWSTVLDGGSGLADGATNISAQHAGKVAVGGWRTGATGDDWMIAQLDLATGAVDWSVFRNGTASGNDRVRGLEFGSDGSLWASGSSAGAGTGVDFVTERLDASGNVLSSQRWNNTAADLDDQPYKLVVGDLGQAWVCGSTTYSTNPTVSDVVVLQYDAQGALAWEATFSSAGLHDDRAFDAELAPNHRIALGGYTTGGPSGGYDYMALQVDLSESPWGYCTAKTNTLGCLAALGFGGVSSASTPTGFTVTCSNVRNQKSGLLFCSVSGAQAGPFQGGYMCVVAPSARTPLQNSGGSAAPSDDCSGVFSTDMNAFAAGLLGGSPFPALGVPGTAVYCEYWSRDPGASFNTNLSSALRYVVLP